MIPTDLDDQEGKSDCAAYHKDNLAENARLNEAFVRLRGVGEFIVVRDWDLRIGHIHPAAEARCRGARIGVQPATAL